MPEGTRTKPQDRLLSRKKPQRLTVRIALDNDVAIKFQDAKSDLDWKKQLLAGSPDSPNARSDVTVAQATYDQLEAQIKEESILITLQSIGRNAYDKLVRDHRFGETAKTRFLAEGGDATLVDEFSWDPYTFPQAIVQACCIDPKLSDEDITDLFDGENWNAAEIDALITAAVAANTQRRVVELGKG